MTLWRIRASRRTIRPPPIPPRIRLVKINRCFNALFNLPLSVQQSIGVFCTETIPLSARHLTVSGGPGSTHHRFQLTNGAGGQQTITTINGNTIIEYPVISSDDKDLKSPSSTASCASSASSTSSLYNSATSPNPTSGSGQNGSASGASTPHQHFHKKYLREEHVKQLKQVSSSYVTPVKQLSR